MDNLQTRCTKFQNDIALLEKGISLIDTGEKATSLSDKSELKKNTLEIKQLRMQVEDLQARLKRQQLSELNVLDEALKGKWKGSDIRGKSAKEIFQMVESYTLKLRNKNTSLSQKLKFLKSTLKEENKSLKGMIDTCQDLNEPSEAYALQHIQSLQNEHIKVMKSVKENEDIRNMMKYLLENLKKRNRSHYELLMNLKEEIADLEKNGQKQNREESENSSEKEKTLQNLKEKISIIRDATGIGDIKNIDYWFLEQRQEIKNFKEMEEKLDKRLQDLKIEKREIASRKAALREAGSLYPNKEEEVSMRRRHLGEQETRRDSAQSELRRLDSVSNAAKSVLENILKAVAMKTNIKIPKTSEVSICDLAKHLEEVMLRAIPKSAVNSASRAGK